MKISVLFLIDSLTCGGAEKSLVSLLPLLDYSKIDVDLMMVNRGGVYEQYIPSKVNVILFPKPSGWFFRLRQFLFSIGLRMFPKIHGAEMRWKTMSQVYKKLEKEYDVAIAYQQGFPTYYVAEKVSAKRKCAWVNVDIRSAGYRELFNRPFYDKMDRIVAVSDALYQMLAKSDFVNPKILKTVYDIINVDFIKKLSHEKKIQKENEFVITTVGRCVFQKGYDLAVEAALLLNQRGLLFKWYFVGGGDQEPIIKQKIKDAGLEEYIEMVGMQPNPYPYMAAADVYVQTSRFEGFGLTLNEARILNKPVVSTDFPVVFDQIRDGENGLICQMTPESIAEKIMILVNDKFLRNKLVEATKLEVNTTSETEPQKVMGMLLQ